MRVLNFGSINIDKVYTVSHFVEQGETLKSLHFAEYEGGKGFNQSIALSKAGLTVHHAGKIGRDGQKIKHVFAQNGINADLVLETGSVTGHAVIQVNEQGQNCIIVHGGANDEITTEEMEQIISACDQGDVLLVQGEMSILDRLVDTAFRRGMRIVLNPSPVSKQIKNLDYSQIEYLVMNEIEALSIFGYSSIEQTVDHLMKQYPKMRIVITLGEKGCVYADRHQRHEQKAFCTEVIDSTAAGDAFLGYFICRMLQSNDVKESLQIAAKAAAIAVSRKGAAASIPSSAEVFALLGWAEKGE